jgi:hypothetical protein
LITSRQVCPPPPACDLVCRTDAPPQSTGSTAQRSPTSRSTLASRTRARCRSRTT